MIKSASAGGDARSAATPLFMTTEGIPAPERFDHWRGSFRALHVVEAEAAVRADFKAGSVNWKLGPLSFGIFHTPARRVERSRKRCLADDIDHFSLVVCRDAVMHLEDDAGASSRAVALHSLGRPYRTRWTEGTWLWVNLPRAVDPALSRRLDRLDPHAAQTVGQVLFADFAVSLARRLPGIPAADLPALGEATTGMIAACFAAGAAPAPAPRERVERLILAHLGSARLDVARLATLSGMSRSSLHRLFEAEGGVSRHILATRLQLVRRDLANPAFAAESVTTLAERRGFHDPASFSRAFRRAFACTPRAFRAAAAAGPPHGARGPAPLSFADLLRRPV